MFDAAAVQLALALGDVRTRATAAQALAAHFGATALILLVHDVEIGVPLPAAGFPRTLPGGAAWRNFLEQLRAPGLHRSRVAYPTTETLVPVLGHTTGGLSLVLVGSSSAEPDARIVDDVAPVLPMLAALLRAEHAETAAHGEIRAAQNHAREVTTLANALDAARSEVERTVRELELESRAADAARTRAEEATRAKDEFLAMLGHELRNPLSPIVIALQLMRLRNQSSRELDVIERQVGSLMRLVDDLLDVSRITGGKIELRKERIELAAIAAQAIEMASPIVERKRQVMRLKIPVRGLMLDVDPSRIAQVLSNLLTNAAKYSDPETEIVFSAKASGGDVRISVKDQGIGIAPEMLTTVFGLFVQNRQSLARSQGGLGLGLAIVRSLVQLHGGTVVASSAGAGQGSEFIVTLPLAASDGNESNAPRPARAAAAPRVGDRLRVLVVDDSNDITMMMADALETLGCDVRTAPDGPAALRLAAEFKPRLALVDIGLPVMDGYELAERLRHQHPSGLLQLVAITGYGQREDRERALGAGFDDHLVKPVSLDDIHRVIETIDLS